MKTIKTIKDLEMIYDNADYYYEDVVYREDGIHMKFITDNEELVFFIPKENVNVSVNYRNDNQTMESVRVNLYLDGQWWFDFDEFDPHRLTRKDLINDIIGWY